MDSSYSPLVQHLLVSCRPEWQAGQFSQVLFQGIVVKYYVKNNIEDVWPNKVHGVRKFTKRRL